MKGHFVVLGICLVCSVLSYSCSEDTYRTPEILNASDLDTLHFASSLKGWELYSWPTGDDWNYALTSGTNTLKEYDDIIGQQIVVTGLECLELLLERMPENEDVVWMSETWLNQIWMTSIYDLSLPSDTMVKEVADIFTKHSINLQIDR